MLYFMKEGHGMKRGVIITAFTAFLGAGLLTAGISAAADDPAGPGGVASIGGKQSLKGEAVKSLKGRVWSQWADNPDKEILFGIQYWNTGDPASGTPAGRSSSDLDVKPPIPSSLAARGDLPVDPIETIPTPVGIMPRPPSGYSSRIRR